MGREHESIPVHPEVPPLVDPNICKHVCEEVRSLCAHTCLYACFSYLQAIKIFSKSILMRRRQYQRNGDGRMAVTTDMDKVTIHHYP